MGLGPSMKMTTLHHYHCLLTAELARQSDITFAGILADGVSELFDDKIFTAERTAHLAAKMQADGAIVTADGFGNHHDIDALFRNGARRIAAGILAVHQAADRIAEEIRQVLSKLECKEEEGAVTETFTDTVSPGLPRVVLVRFSPALAACMTPPSSRRSPAEFSARDSSASAAAFPGPSRRTSAGTASSIP